MKRRAFLIISLAIIFCGCTHTYKLNSKASTFNEINTILKSQKARITLVSGRTFIGKGLQVACDSTSWFDLKTNVKHTVSNLEIKKIVTLKRGRGALEGLMYGAMIGCTAGFIYGVANGVPLINGNDEYGFGSILACCSFGTIYVGAHGLPIGLIIGSKDKYIFITPMDSSLTQNMKD